MKLWLLRHAQVALDAGLCYGASDVPADEELTKQAAQAVAARLPTGLPVRVSGLLRAQQLARELQRLRPDLGAARIDARLDELNFGCWELQRWDAIPRRAFDRWLSDFGQHRFGGVQSTQELIERVAAALAAEQHAAVSNQGRESVQAEQEALWITHAGVIRAVQYLLRTGTLAGAGPGISSVGQWPEHAPAPGGWISVSC